MISRPVSRWKAHASIDVFAGTGALGIEALSRGAAYALFVDDSADSRALIRKNVEALNLTGATKIWRRDATDMGPLGAGAGGPFELAFLDAPYRKGLTDKALASLAAGGWLAPNAIAVAETAAGETDRTAARLRTARPPRLWRNRRSNLWRFSRLNLELANIESCIDRFARMRPRK